MLVGKATIRPPQAAVVGAQQVLVQTPRPEPVVQAAKV
jgi:hypothetical protein